jgi:hypothetical protein
MLTKLVCFKPVEFLRGKSENYMSAVGEIVSELVSNRPRKKSSFKPPREPRYAIKTRTDVDIMDDGFKWRKYGQKAVKNSPHP